MTGSGGASMRAESLSGSYLSGTWRSRRPDSSTTGA